MNRSPEVNELVSALAQAQAEIGTAERDSINPHFGSTYAGLASVLSACRAPLTKHGLSIVQSPRLIHAGDEWVVEVETLLFHSSGQFLADTVAVPVPQINAQSLGSAVTYLKRYAVSAFIGIAPAGEDDDGNLAVSAAAAAARKRTPPSTRAPAAEKPRAASAPGSTGVSRPDPTPETITVKVIGIVKRPISNGRAKYLISADDRAVYATFSESVAKDAKSAQEAGRPIAIRYKTTQYGRDITALTEAPEPPL
jgi:hypothetical protein